MVGESIVAVNQICAFRRTDRTAALVATVAEMLGKVYDASHYHQQRAKGIYVKAKQHHPRHNKDVRMIDDKT